MVLLDFVATLVLPAQTSKQDARAVGETLLHRKPVTNR